MAAAMEEAVGRLLGADVNKQQMKSINAANATDGTQHIIVQPMEKNAPIVVG